VNYDSVSSRENLYWTQMRDHDLLVLSPLLVLTCLMTDSLLKQVLNKFITFITSKAVQNKLLIQMILY